MADTVDTTAVLAENARLKNINRSMGVENARLRDGRTKLLQTMKVVVGQLRDNVDTLSERKCHELVNLMNSTITDVQR